MKEFTDFLEETEKLNHGSLNLDFFIRPMLLFR